MRRMAIMLAATATLMFSAAPWQAQAQIERGPAALANTAQNCQSASKRDPPSAWKKDPS
jgi:hypothetical protein